MAWDCIVVGAGPSGGAAAYYLARSGAKVLLLEAKRMPRDKICSGIVTRYTEQAVLPIIGPQGLDDVTIGSCGRTRVEGCGRTVQIRHRDLRFVDRRRLDYAVAMACADRGVELQDAARLTDAVRDEDGLWHVTCRVGETQRTFEFQARYLVDAEGSESILARRLQPEAQYALALEVAVPYAGDPEAVIDWSAGHGAFFWLLPKRDGVAGVGGGTIVPGEWRALPARVRAHFTERGVACPDRLPGHRLRYVGRGPVARDGLLLVGEAAGAIDRAFGEGMRSAFVTGRMAAEAILAGGDAAARYNRTFQRRWRPFLHQRATFSRINAALPLTPLLAVPGLGSRMLRSFLG